MTSHRIDFKYLDDDSIIVDGGACKGSFINDIRKHLNCMVYAIEPNVGLIAILKDKKYSNINIIEKALVGQNSKDHVQFFAYESLPKWGNIYNRQVIHRKLTGVSNYQVETIRINDVFRVLQINHIDFLKLDVEEAEFDIFSTMTSQTAEKINQFSVEFHKINYTNNDIDCIINRINKLGYKHKWVYDYHELWGIRKCLSI